MKLELADIKITTYPLEDKSAKVDLTLEVTENEGKLSTWFQYSSALFSPRDIEAMAAHFIKILEGIAIDPNAQLTEVEMILDEERHHLLNGLNPEQVQSNERPLHEIIEEQATLRPEQLALVSKNNPFTYEEINKQANRLARSLQNKMVQKGDRIGVMLRRSDKLIITLLAILKTGATYVPIDPDYPEDRIAFMANDSEVKCIIADDELHLQTIKEKMWKILELMDTSQDGSNLDVDVSADDLAYIIYTSGSTGHPKGVMVPHRSVQNFIEGISDAVGFSADESMLALTTISFDIFVTETFLPLAKGASVIMASEEEQLDPTLLSQLILDQKVTYIQATPSRIKGLMMYPEGEKCLASVKALIVGGEAFPPTLLQRLQGYDRLSIYNAYGPTETTVWSTIKNVTLDQQVTIGQPIRNTQCYIVDPHNRLQPIGIFGELCIAGSGVSQGYWNQPEMTAEKFVKNPFGSSNMMYRTGDLVRWLPDGHIEYASRMDQQVKMRGYRIELQEIEAQLEKMASIQEAAVALHKDSTGDDYLCGYLVWEDSQAAISLETIKAQLLTKLPGYMVPTQFLMLEELPLTANGKLDRKALPKPDLQALRHEAPRTPIEKVLSKIWSKVLGVSTIGIHENFFSLGGESLKGIKLTSDIYKLFNTEIKIKDLFENPTIHLMSRLIQNQVRVNYKPISVAKEADTYPVTSAQKRLFILNEMEEISVSYNMPAVLKVNGSLNLNNLQKAFNKLIKRHEILRTSFEMVDNEPFQIIHKDVNNEINVLQIDYENIDSFIETSIKPFNLFKPSLIRMTVIEAGKNHQYLILDMHHIVSDGLSLELIEKELFDLYHGINSDKPILQYKDYASWQKEMLNQHRLDNQEEYWLNQFKEKIPLLEMPLDYDRPRVKTYKGNRYEFKINSELLKHLNKIANDTNTTLFMILLSCYQITLGRFSGQEDIVVGTPVSGRTHPDVHSLIGMFVNMLPIRLYPEGKKPFKEFLQEVKRTTLDSFANQDYPFEELIKKLDLERDPGRNPIFDAAFVLQNKAIPRIQMDELILNPYKLKTTTSKFDLMLEAFIEDKELHLNLQYCNDLFNEQTIARFSKCFLNIIKAICSDSNRQIYNLEMISELEELEILKYSIGPKTDYYSTLTIQEVFEKQAEVNPEKTAVVSHGYPLTYRELNDKANQLGYLLKNKGIQQGETIAILMEPSAEMIVSFLAILKAGAVYLPLNKEIPENRLKFMLKDSLAKFLFVDSALTIEFDSPAEILNIKELPFEDGIENNLNVSNTPEDLAYIMYTSGTTGEPKGVMVTHKNINRLVNNTNYIEFNDSDQILLTGATGFDATTFEIWGALLNGLTVHLCRKELFLEAKDLSDYISRHQISVLWLTSSLFNQYAEYYKDMFTPLRYLIVGGEVLSIKHINLATQLKTVKIINAYGPTENTTFSTYYPVNKLFNSNIPIGRPISNSSTFIVDKFNNLQPIGVIGEIYVGGAGVARGYLNNPDLTASKFIENPFIEGDRIYRTGDLGRWLQDGNIEYIGRKDNQIKIRGYRIELKEIEAALLSHPSVKNGTVSVFERPNNQKVLCAYYVLEDSIDSDELRRELQKTLPGYMVPTMYKEMETLPLTSNGKLDIQSLPQPDLETTQGITLPINEIEEILVNIFKEVLGFSKISTDDSFFDLGGDSIKALQISAKLYNLHLKMEVKDLFRYPTIKSITPFIKRDLNEEFQGIIEGKVSLTPIQKWFFEKQGMEHYWNQAIMLASEIRIVEKNVKVAMKKLIEHHDALRMTFNNDTTVKQFNRGISCLEEKLFSFEVFSYESIKNYETKIEQKMENLHQKINLQGGPLISLGLFKTKQQDFLVFIVHHLVIDGVSWRILIEDFISSYLALEKGHNFNLPKKTASYQSWSEILSSYSQESHLYKEAEYWRQILVGNFSSLKQVEPAHENIVINSSTVQIEIDEQVTNQLMNEVNQAFNTEINDILLSALTLSLKDWTGNEMFLINMEGHGRESMKNDINISRTIGWFTSIYPIKLDAQYSDDKALLIKKIKEMIRGIPNKGMNYGIIKHLCPFNNNEVFTEKEEAQISFNYLGEYGKDLNGPFGLSSLPLGKSINSKSVRTHDIEIIGKVVNGNLQFQWEYNGSQYSNTDIEAWSNCFKSHLIELINFCSMKEKAEFTPSDFGENHNLSLEDIENLQDLLEAKFKS
ncbi:amino acid adenylation domain-containing protein/non-ribosomal peptide synthase protein (TIGR01720 family) [Cytobacillus purgationiresistens]|uniref:Amino acid adenylation domain-containing protein/non-ribosomal peptide synthase protein (TIGR01720 family) n=2 Tax=Cytobacillus purgationiresistens TaxID=863449 RepID=A0ABU0ASZ2_9BACI|nr:amino acid adenylation domain-containing protein/non-ribosomal peptide synthase protein (TIGR01720 family) [Cytobacillus purgationiresistens]